MQALKALVACAPHANDQQRAELEIFARHLLDDEHPVVRTQVALILGAAGYESDIPILAQLVSDDDWFVRRAAAKALAQMGSPGLAALRRLAASDDRFAAERAREEITFATIMAARLAADTGQDFEGILTQGSVGANRSVHGSDSSPVLAVAAAGASIGVHATATVPTEAPSETGSEAPSGHPGHDTPNVPSALAPATARTGDESPPPPRPLRKPAPSPPRLPGPVGWFSTATSSSSAHLEAPLATTRSRPRSPRMCRPSSSCSLHRGPQGPSRRPRPLMPRFRCHPQETHRRSSPHLSRCPRSA
ncbi:MAG: hypothetical protein QG597_896 [Actinomycetota bacterium]|nr:hypothetical protein [Actinomycetota bacterium]